MEVTIRHEAGWRQDERLVVAILDRHDRPPGKVVLRWLSPCLSSIEILVLVSVTREDTCESDILDADELRAVIQAVSEAVAERVEPWHAVDGEDDE